MPCMHAPHFGLLTFVHRLTKLLESIMAQVENKVCVCARVCVHPLLLVQDGCIQYCNVMLMTLIIVCSAEHHNRPY